MRPSAVRVFFSTPAIVFLLAACAAQPPSSLPLGAVIYDCDNGTVLRARLEGKTADIALGNGTHVRLPNRHPVSGIWYGTSEHDLRGKGDEVHWTVTNRPRLTCKVRQS